MSSSMLLRTTESSQEQENAIEKNLCDHYIYLLWSRKLLKCFELTESLFIALSKKDSVASG